jgi:hypothetical protein
MSFVEFYQIKKFFKTKGDILLPWVFLFTIFIFLCYNLINFINIKAVNILFWDQWGLFEAFFNQNSLFDVFRWQHGPHRQGIAFVINSFLQTITNWNTHTESLLIGAIIITSCIMAIYIKFKLFKKINYSDIIIPFIFLSVSQYEIFIGTPNFSHGSFSLFLFMLYILSWLIDNFLIKFLFINTFNFLLIYSGMGLFIGILTPMFFILDYLKQRVSLKYLIINLIISITCFLTFFIDYRFIPAADCFKFPDPNFYLYPVFVSRMFTNFLSLQNFGLISYLFGSILMVIIFYILAKTFLNLRNNHYYPTNLILIILLCFPLIFAFNTSFGRLCIGLNSANSSRYVTYLIPSFFGIYLYLLTLKNKGTKNFLILLFLIALFISYSKSFSNQEIDWYYKGKTNWKNCYLQFENISLCDLKTNFKIYPYPNQTNLKFKLDYLKQNKLNLYNGN